MLKYERDEVHRNSMTIKGGEYKATEIKEQLQKRNPHFIDEIGLQWLALWLLSIVGLFLSIRNRRKVAAIDKTQTTLKTKQAQNRNRNKTNRSTRWVESPS